MNIERPTNPLREDWSDRQRELGNQPRAVLMKGLPPLVNGTIDQWHRALMRAAFCDSPRSGEPLALDVGCGYGRLAGEAKRCGLDRVVGIDFAAGFCVDFNRNHGPAVCGDLASLPFADRSFSAAYSVTSLMYLPTEAARRAIAEMDRCLAEGSVVLVVEPSREFNDLVRSILRKKRSETLAMPGFSLEEFMQQLPPANWQRIGAGDCRWTTRLLPLLVAASRFPRIYHRLSRIALRLDRPRMGRKGSTARITMYQWAAYRKAADGANTGGHA